MEKVYNNNIWKDFEKKQISTFLYINKNRGGDGLSMDDGYDNGLSDVISIHLSK